MTRKLLFLILPLFLLVFVSVVNAQTSTGTESAASRLKRQIQVQKENTRAEFKARLAEIKDQKKKALVERIDAKLATVNKKHTDRFAKVLNSLQSILDKMTEDIDKTEAQGAIDTAKAAVEDQAAKTYTITISTEVALRSDVGKVTSQLRLDLMATHKLVIDAKQAVQILRAEGKMEKEATGSANL